MALPTLTLYVGLGADILLEGPSSNPLDLSTYDEAAFESTGLGILKTSADVAEAVIQGTGNKDLLVKIVPSDTSGLDEPQDDHYQLKVRSGTDWFDVAGVGVLKVRKKG